MENTSYAESSLVQRKCKPCEGGTKPLDEATVQQALKGLEGWSLENGKIVRTFKFQNYYQTMAFVNAVAWIAHREDHHPTMEVAYKTCKVLYSTHSIGGISDNDLICAAKANALVK